MCMYVCGSGSALKHKSVWIGAQIESAAFVWMCMYVCVHMKVHFVCTLNALIFVEV